jgi:hypothetical protein
MFSERTQVLLTPAQRARLERLAEERQSSVGAVIREAIDAYTIRPHRSGAEAFAVLCSLNAPVLEWDEMKAEILAGAIG